MKLWAVPLKPHERWTDLPPVMLVHGYDRNDVLKRVRGFLVVRTADLPQGRSENLIGWVMEQVLEPVALEENVFWIGEQSAIAVYSRIREQQEKVSG